MRDPEEPLSRAELARRCGVSSTTLRNWTQIPDRPLATKIIDSGTVMYTWAALLCFCDDHPNMPAVQIVRRHTSTRSTSMGMGDNADEATLRAALRDMKTAVDASVTAVARAAALSREVASAHEEIVAALSLTIRAYDSAMTSATAPAHGPM